MEIRKTVTNNLFKNWLTILLVAVVNVPSLAQTTYYSRDGGTSDWDLSTSWTTSSDGVGAAAGPPTQTDYVIILNGHTITVDDITDNGGAGQSADGLDLANVAKGVSYPLNNPFPHSGTLNFFHNGEMTVEEGGTLNFNTRVMFNGTIFIAGTLNTSADIITLGNFYFSPTASFSSLDDLILSGNSNTRIDIPNAADSFTNDDIYIDHTDAFVCGLGILNIGQSGGPGHIINLRNSATLAQICTVLQITGCSPDPPGTCPAGTTVYNPSIAALTGAGGTINYVENDVLTIDNSISVTYAELFPYLTAATVTISSGYVDGEGILTLPGISTIVAVFDTGSGTLNLSGYGDVARWETALQSVTYENLSDNPTTTTRTIEFQVNDGFNPSNTISRDITIQRVNDPPDVSTISGTPTPLDYTEGDGAVDVDDQITLADPDDVNLESATISLTNYIVGEDFLDFTDAFGVTKVGFNSTLGILSLTGTATIANYQLALRSVTYENISDTPDLNSRTANFVVNDGDANSPPFSRDIDITATNDLPIINGTLSPLAYTEGDGAVLLDNSVVVTDADNANLASATLTISANFQLAEDVLAFTDQNGITGSYLGGVLTLSGSSTKAFYQTAIQSVTYENTSADPDPSTRTVDFMVNDGAVNSTTFSRDITVLPVNSLPVISGTLTTLAYTEGDGAVLLDNGVLITDADNANIASATITISTNFQAVEDVLAFTNQNGITGAYVGGALTLSGSATKAFYQTAIRSVTYENTSTDPDASTRTVDFIVNDGVINSATFSRDITVLPVNSLPVISGTLTDLTYTEGDGAVQLDNGVVVTDIDNANIASATLTISTNFQALEDILAFTNQNGITGDYVGGVLSLSGSATKAFYQTAIRSVTYENTSADPDPSTRTVDFVINDGMINSGTFSRDIIVLPVNTAPVIAGTLTDLAYTEGAGAVLLDNVVLVTDVDNANIASGTLTISANFQVAEDFLAFTNQNGITGSYVAGVLTLSGSATKAFYQTAIQSVTYENTSTDPDPSTRTVDFVVNDGAINSNTFSRDIIITPINSLPTITGTLTDLIYTEGDGPVPIDNAITVSDIDNTNLASATIGISSNFTSTEDVLVFTNQNGISGLFAGGVLTLTGATTLLNYETAIRSITYENTSSNPNTATRVLSYSTNDGTDNSILFNRNILITAVNSPPVITGTTSPLNYTEGDGAVLLDVLTTVLDTDSPNLASATITFTSNFQATEDVLDFVDQNGINGNFAAGVLSLNGSASLNSYVIALRSITYENTSGNPDNSTRTVSLIVNDGGLASTAFTRDIQITPINTIPVIAGAGSDLNYIEGDGPVVIDNTITVSDIDNTNLASATISFTSNFQASEDILAITDQNGITGSFSSGILSLVGSASLVNYQTAMRSITYENTSSAPNTTNRTLEMIVNDGTDNSLPFVKIIMITPIVEPPVIGTGSGGTGSAITINYTEGDGSIALNNTFSIADADDTNLESASLNFNTNYLETEDVLALANQSGITGSFDSATGILTLSGTASIGDYQTAVRNITYENTSEAPSNLARTLLLSVNDGDTDSNTIDITINVIPVNDAPVVVGTNTDLIYTESSGPVVIDEAILPTDVDDLQLESASIAIIDNYIIDEDFLNFSDQLGIAGQFDSNSGILTLTGAANLGDYQAALRSVTYENSMDIADLGIRTVEFIVNDGDLPSASFTRDILIEEVEDQVIVYQVVTPDGDSFNDTWVIDGIEQFPNNNVSVFNRWNSLVYKQDSYDNQGNAWAGEANEGISKGDLPDGTYFYTVNLGDGSASLEGFLVLKRK